MNTSFVKETARLWLGRRRDLDCEPSLESVIIVFWEKRREAQAFENKHNKMAEPERKTRRNGLSTPYSPTQLSTWVTLPTLLIQFGLFVTPILPLAASVPVSVVVLGLGAASAYYAVVTMQIDPSDPRLLLQNSAATEEQPSGANHNHHHQNQEVDPSEATKHCWICDTSVAETSMHCKFCNKCVDHFDHHCMCKCTYGIYT